MHHPAALLLATLTLPFLAQADSVRSTTDLYPSEVVIERDGERWLCELIVDDLTGRPIAGAELFLVQESPTPIAGRFWFTRKAMSDAHGIVRVPVGDIEGSWNIQVVRAEGYAVSSRSGYGEPIWRLAPPQDVPVLVHDWRGLPVPGALIGLCGSCGHGPDLVHATSDASGVAILRGVDPHNDIADLYCQARGLGLGYESLSWRPGDPPHVLTCENSPPLTGRLVDHAGSGIAGAHVGVPSVHRGPWAETGADGAFEVLGAPEGSEPIAVVGGREIHFPTPRGYPVVLRMPAPEAPPFEEGTIDDSAAEPPPAVATTSIAVRVEDDGEGSAIWALAPGRGEQPAQDGLVDVPTSGPFVLGIGERRYAYASIRDLPPQPVLLRDYAPTILRADVVDERGRAVAVRASLRRGGDEPTLSVDAPDGSVELAVRATGTFLLEITPERGDLRPRLVLASLPHPGDAVVVDLGRIALAREPQLRVLAPDGGPRTNVRVRFLRAGHHEIGSEPIFPLDPSGGWLGPDLRAGDALIVEPVLASQDEPNRTAVAFRTMLAGDGPWSITAPTGALALSLRGLARPGDAAFVLIGDQVFEVEGAAELFGLPAGPLQLAISAAGRRTTLVTTTIPATGKKSLVVELEER